MDSLGDRMKHNYENRFRYKLTRRIPVIMRLDGRAFHTLTRGMKRPFDDTFIRTMNFTAIELLKEIQGSKCAYVQSDEISILITDFDRLETDAWFDYNIQKMCSIASGIASVEFSKLIGKIGIFDCRVFNIPKEEVTNYFIWRQNDFMRNSLSMLAQSHFSSKQLNKKNRLMMDKILKEKGVIWDDLDSILKNGSLIFKKEDGIIAIHEIIKENRTLIEKLLEVKEY